jgi:1-deoxyxylulose-5-phosphate synthase
MNRMNRRTFLSQTAAAVGVSVVSRALAVPPASQPAATRPAGKSILRATDQVLLGRTGLKASRLAIGTGTKSGSEQHRAGPDAMVRLLRSALDDGIRWWDAADMYHSHPYLGRALKEIKRDQVTITSKTQAHDAAGALADIERFRKELGTDYIDILLLHCMEDPGWPSQKKGAVDALREAKDKGWVRAVGCSCHSLEALKASADEPWVDVVLARTNPFAVIMDVPEASQVPKVDAVLRTLHERGKVVYGMKILGEGLLKDDRIDQSLRSVLAKPYVSGFTIGFSAKRQIDDIVRRIERIGATA